MGWVLWKISVAVHGQFDRPQYARTEALDMADGRWQWIDGIRVELCLLAPPHANIDLQKEIFRTEALLVKWKSEKVKQMSREAKLVGCICGIDILRDVPW
jgi:hypothetical protein